MAGKLSRPGLYENRSTNNTLSDEKDIPGSMTAFLTSLPSCKKTVNLDVSGSSSKAAVAAGFFTEKGSSGGSGVLAGVDGKGGIGGVVACRSEPREGERRDTDELPPRVGGGEEASSSSTSVRTANSPGVRADETAMERRLACPRTDRSREVEPVILDILYVEYRFDALRSRASLCLRAASELAIAGTCAASMGGVSEGGVSGEAFLSSEGCSGLDGSTTRLGAGGGDDIGLSTKEYRFMVDGTAG